jgi:hypothetical protein
MKEHPMSEGQKKKVWKIVDGERIPCKVEDLRPGDYHARDGWPEIVVCAQRPIHEPDGWTGLIVTPQEWEEYKRGEREFVNADGTPFEVK